MKRLFIAAMAAGLLGAPGGAGAFQARGNAENAPGQDRVCLITWGSAADANSGADATALQHFHLIYLVGSLFVGIAYQPFIWLVVGTEIGFDNWLRRKERKARASERRLVPAPAL